MRTPFSRTLCVLYLAAATCAAAAADKKGCSDHPLFTQRMPDYSLVECQSKEFERYEFFVAKGPKNAVEGRFFLLTYQIDNRTNEPSGVAVVRNYENALAKIGGSTAASDPQRWVNGKVMVDGKEIWVQAEKGNGKIWLRIVEKEAMKQHVVADAASFKNDLKTHGHVAVQGIFFDTGKSVVKPESKPALEEVAKLLKSDPGLRLWVVGHTDAVGKTDDNMRLAQARAEAVSAELVAAHGVGAAQIKAYGVGPLAPVAGNDTEDGRTKNRRVELVKQP